VEVGADRFGPHQAVGRQPGAPFEAPPLLGAWAHCWRWQWQSEVQAMVELVTQETTWD
jgi:hypothetical protein